MNELYNHSKVKAMVSFTKGEGFQNQDLELPYPDLSKFKIYTQ